VEELFQMDGYFAMELQLVALHMQIFLQPLALCMVKEMARQLSTFQIIEVDSFVAQIIWVQGLLVVIQMPVLAQLQTQEGLQGLELGLYKVGQMLHILTHKTQDSTPVKLDPKLVLAVKDRQPVVSG
jgi:hypothetical protein